MGVLIILTDGTRGQGLGLKLWSRDGDHQGLYQLGGEVRSGSRFLGRRNRFGRSGARSPGRPLCRFRSGSLSARRSAPLGCQICCGSKPVAGTLAAARPCPSHGEDPDRPPTHRPRRGGFQTRPRPGQGEGGETKVPLTTADRRSRPIPERTTRSTAESGACESGRSGLRGAAGAGLAS
jgi:hypothetical protein